MTQLALGLSDRVTDICKCFAKRTDETRSTRATELLTAGFMDSMTTGEKEVGTGEDAPVADDAVSLA